MRKKPEKPPEIDETAERPYNGADDEAELLEGEGLQTWSERQDEKEGRKHDANESRREPKWLEDYDPHLGVN